MPELFSINMDKAGKYIEEDSPVMEGLKNELDDLIEPFQLCFVLYGGKVMYLDIFSYSMFPFGKSCSWSHKNLVRESLSIIAIKCDCKYSCYRPLILYQAVKCLGWLRQFSRDFSTNPKSWNPGLCEVNGRWEVTGKYATDGREIEFSTLLTWSPCADPIIVKGIHGWIQLTGLEVYLQSCTA